MRSSIVGAILDNPPLLDIFHFFNLSTTTHGTGLHECLGFGLPSASRISSTFPWSAVTRVATHSLMQPLKNHLDFYQDTPWLL
ncbi:MAG: hypothetical protein CM15mP93_04410 [Thiotrichaceae bacterium]|nr:MAG: hypothetical protein CM15mP93_04410 [Thiotrichaceae bacterium]